VSDSYLMPSLGSGMTHGTVIEWYVQPGQAVRKGDVIGLVDTDKGAIEVEVWEDAEVAEILAPPGTKAPVGEPLLALRASEGKEEIAAPELPAVMIASKEASGEAPPSPAPPAVVPPTEGAGVRSLGAEVRASPVARKRAAELDIDLSSLAGTGPGGAITLADVERAVPEGGLPSERGGLEVESPPPPREEPTAVEATHVRVTPLARKVAEELGVSLEGIHGTGPGGAVTRADVEAGVERETIPEQATEAIVEGAAAEKRPAAPEDTPADRHTAMRRAIAKAMERSKREIPHYYLATTVPVERALRWLERTNLERAPDGRILLVSLHLKAVALTLQEYPELNGFWEKGAFRGAGGIHPGLAISLRGGGLVAPAIHDVPAKSLNEITVAVRDLVQRARVARLRGSEVTDPTVTVTSLGDRGVETVFGVIYPPQVAIVGIGKVAERPWAEGGMLGVKRVVRITLAADHRASDGHRGGLFLERVAEHLQHPEKL